MTSFVVFCVVDATSVFTTPHIFTHANVRGDDLPLTQKNRIAFTKNVLRVGVYGEGVFRYDGKSWTKFSSKGGPAFNNVFSVAVGPDGSLWFGTDGGGIPSYQSSN